MKKVPFLLILYAFILSSCATGKLIDQNSTLRAKTETVISSADLKSLEKTNERSQRIANQMGNKITYGLSLLDELSLAFMIEKQQAFNEGYQAGKKDAEEAMKGYIRLEDVEQLLKEKGLLKEEK